MHYRHAILAALLLLLAVPAAAQVVPSAYTPLGICSLYSALTPANTDVFIQARDRCNIPQEANAVALIAATTGPSGNGVLYVWEAGIFQPAIPSMYTRSAPGGDSSTLIVRLCYPFQECGIVEDGVYAGTDLHARLTASAFLTLSVVGAFTPLP